MKLQKPKQLITIGTAASLALLLAMGTANAAKGDGPNRHGASIIISNACTLAFAPKPVLRVTTTLIDDSSGDDGVDFTIDGTTVRAKEKAKGKGPKVTVGAPAVFTPQLGVNVTDIQLCDANGVSLLSDDTVSLNTAVSINVDNDNKGEYSNRCSDDPSTDGINEGTVDVRGIDFTDACAAE